MSKLPHLSGKEVIKALSKVGFQSARQRGSHVILVKQTENEKIGTAILGKGTLLRGVGQAEA